MTNHTTHFDDCGCKSERLEAKIASLAKELDEARGQIAILEKQQGNSFMTNLELSNQLAAARAEIEAQGRELEVARAFHDVAVRERNYERARVNHLVDDPAASRRTAEYWKAEHLAGNAEIERLTALIKKGIEAVDRYNEFDDEMALDKIIEWGDTAQAELKPST